MISATAIASIARDRLDPERAAIQAEAEPPPDPFGVVWAAALAAPLQPIEWLCEALALAKGTFALVAGSAFSGKSLMLADLALSVATGSRVFGTFSATQGRVLWLDFDGQGLRTSSERFQRLARARGVDLAELGQALGYAWMPSIKLDSHAAVEEFTRLLQGVSLCIIDSWRGAATGTDEASRAEVQRVGEAILRIVQATGCTIVLVDHTVKPPVDGKNTRSKMHDVHGSTAKSELPPVIWSMSPGKEPLTATMTNTKNRVEGKTKDPISLRFADVGRGDERRWGLSVGHLDDEEMAREEEAAAARAHSRQQVRVLEWLGAHAGVFRGTKQDFALSVGGKKDATYRAITALEQEQKLVRNTEGRTLEWRLGQ